MTRLMRPEDIPAFVDAVIETGCDICAIGDDLYVLGDADLPDDQLDTAMKQLRDIQKQFGERDYLRLEIVAHLRSLGRYIDIASDIEHWSQNPTRH